MATLPRYDESSIKQMTQTEHIRSKSSMYIGPGTVEANFNLALEGIKNAQDENLDKNKLYFTKILIFAEGTKYQFAIVDHGRGIPCGKVKMIMTESFTSGKYEKKSYNGVSSGSYGLGLSISSAISRSCATISKRLDGFAGVNLYQGNLIKEYLGAPIDNDPTTVGTTLFLEPDETILKESHLFLSDPNGLTRMLKYLEFSCTFKPNDKTVVYRVNKLLSEKWFKTKSIEEQWRYFQSVTGTVIYQAPEVVDKFAYSKKEFNILDDTVWDFVADKEITEDDSDQVGFEIHLGLTKHPEKNQGIIGMVNYNQMANARDSHIQTLQEQFKAKLLQYLDEDDSELRSFFTTMYFIPFHGYVVALGKNLSYLDQIKSGFISSQWARLYAAQLKLILDKQPDGLYENLFDLIEDDLMTKFSKAINKNLNAGKSLKNVAFELRRSDSYFSCETKDKNQAILHIVEGLSSGNWVTQLRDPSYQAVYELRGKCLNTFTSSQDQCRKDDVFADLVRLIGVHPRDTNLDNMNFKEICIMADADPDGLSIIDLLIGMFYTINPLILEQGRVTIAMPPLYVLSSKDRTMFLRDQHALDDIMVSIYETHLKIGVSVNGSKINYLKGDTYRDVVYLVKHICAIIESVSRKLAIDPFIVEQMCHCVDYIYPGHVNTLAIKQTLGLDDCVYSHVSNVITLIQDKTEISVPIDRLMNEIKIYILPELNSINWHALTFMVTTKDTSYYKDTPVMFWQMRQIFDTFDKEFNIRRIKGLGECTAAELKYTCLDPTTRTVVTIRGIGDVKTLYDMLGVETTERKKLVSSDMNSEWVRGVL